jgi:hypothetical protein
VEGLHRGKCAVLRRPSGGIWGRIGEPLRTQRGATYRERLEEAARAKIVAVTPAGEPTQVMDLMEALRASVEATKAKREGPMTKSA